MMPSAHPPMKAYAALMVVYLVWGTTLGAIHIGIETIPPALLICLRFMLSGILLVGFCLLRKEAFPAFPVVVRHAIAGTLLFFGGNTVISWILEYVPTGLAGMFMATTPFWMLALSALFPPKEKIQPLAVVGIMIGFFGMLVLLSPKLTQGAEVSPAFWLSIAGLLVMTFCWAAGSVYARKHPVPGSLLMGVGLQNLFAGLLLMPIVYWTVPSFDPAVISMASASALAYLVLIGTILTTPCYLYVLDKLPISVSSTFAYVTPLVTLACGWLFLHETVTTTTLWGTGIILSGVILVQWVNQHKPSLPRTDFFRPVQLCPKELS